MNPKHDKAGRFAGNGGGSEKAEAVPAPDGLETVFSPGHQHHARIYYDPKEGKYYDRHSDVYLEHHELDAYGLGANRPKHMSTKSKKPCSVPKFLSTEDILCEARKQSATVSRIKKGEKIVDAQNAKQGKEKPAGDQTTDYDGQKAGNLAQKAREKETADRPAQKGSDLAHPLGMGKLDPALSALAPKQKGK